MTGGERARTAAAEALSEEALVAWGRRLGKEVPAPLVLVLRGDLGAGKTTLARAIARGAGVRGSIPSPTYNLLFRYPATADREIVHIDLYRLEDEDEVWSLGWDELPSQNEVVLIEWGERAERLLPGSRWDVYLRETREPLSRSLELVPVGHPPPIPLPEIGE